MSNSIKRLRFLLLQIRNLEDPIIEQEVDCFAQAIDCPPEQITAQDALSESLSAAQLEGHDVVLIGGSGDYSATSEGDWLDRILNLLREIHQTNKPTFASCWGFQAMARALGGKVIHDPAHAELGTHSLFLTEAGKEDPVFGPLGNAFEGQMGHEDCVVDLPSDAIRLASTLLVKNQAFMFAGRPIYCTQFHPELTRDQLLQRLRAYPQYVEKIAGVPLEQFETKCRDTPESAAILPRFLRHVFE